MQSIRVRDSEDDDGAVLEVHRVAYPHVDGQLESEPREVRINLRQWPIAEKRELDVLASSLAGLGIGVGVTALGILAVMAANSPH